MDCWNANPTLRPPAAFVAQTLLDLVVRESVHLPPTTTVSVPQNVMHAIKTRVSEAIKNEKGGNKEATGIDPHDARILRQSADLNVDPVSSFLLGAAILYGLIPLHVYDQGDPGYASIEPDPEGTRCWLCLLHIRRFTHHLIFSVKHMRVALKYLEIAADADILEARHECGKAHLLLARYYAGK
jgi:hypothetical protein